MKQAKVEKWFDEYKSRSDTRFESFRAALSRLCDNPLILETGTMRGKDDYGAGCSTFIFGDYINRFGGNLITVDNDTVNLETSRGETSQFTGIEYVLGDSVEFLQAFQGTVDLLYLDSMDCPIDGDATDAQRHNLAELLAAEKNLTSKSLVLIDDSGGFDNGGKARWTEFYLSRRGWHPLIQSQQSLWEKSY